MRSLFAATVVVALLGAAVAVNTNTPAPQKQAAVVAPPARAEPGLVWHSGGLTVTLTDKPCPLEEMAQELEEEGIPPARAYIVAQGERRTTGCWAPDIGGDILTRTQAGVEGVIPLEWFTR